MKGLNKEEHQRIKKRTEEKIELAQAKSNYWKWHRGEGRGKRGRQEENDAIWINRRREVTAFEERDGEWSKEMTRVGGNGVEGGSDN